MITPFAPVSRLGLALLGGVAACQPVGATRISGDQPSVFAPRYMAVETRLLEGDLVNFRVRMKGARSKADVADYAKCAAAQYALIRGYGFARHIRTTVEESDGIWRGDAVYTISKALPGGRLTLDAEVVVGNCRDEGIPTV